MAIVSFAGEGTEDLFNGRRSKAARKVCPPEVWEAAFFKLDLLNGAVSLQSLRIPPGNRLEKLSGDRAGQHSIRINRQYRVCFTWTPEGPAEVEVNNHYR